MVWMEPFWKGPPIQHHVPRGWGQRFFLAHNRSMIAVMDGYEPGTIWPAIDADEVQIREVYSRFGLAMFTAQVLEHGLVNALLVLRLLPTMADFANQMSWDAAFDRFYDRELAKTFGNMIRALEETEAISVGLSRRLRAAKERRDFLAHRFFREHDIDFMSGSGRTLMIAECEGLIELFQSLDREVEAVVAPQRLRFGITPDWIAKHVAQMEAEALAGSGGA